MEPATHIHIGIIGCTPATVCGADLNSDKVYSKNCKNSYENTITAKFCAALNLISDYKSCKYENPSQELPHAVNLE